MSITLFERPVEAAPAWEDGTTYTLFLKVEEAKGGPAPASLRVMPAGAGGGFRPNLVVTRDAQGGRDLAKYAEEQRQAIAARLPAAKLLREGSAKIGPLAAHEQEYQVTLDHPLPAVAQWHASVVRDGFC
jgi:hypothetical protein